MLPEDYRRQAAVGGNSPKPLNAYGDADRDVIGEGDAFGRLTYGGVGGNDEDYGIDREGDDDEAQLQGPSDSR